MQLARAYSDVIVGISYVWEGRPIKADEFLQPVIEQAERDSGRRGMIAAMFAGPLAAVAFERDQLARARALLANRLDVIDRVGLPDSVLLAYRTVGDLALAEGDERRAFDAFDALRVLGESRRLPRMVVLSLAEQARIHATHSRPETATALLAQLDALAGIFESYELRPFQRYYQLKTAIARTYVALAAFDDARAEQSLRQAASLAAQLNRGREAIMVMALQAVVMHGQGKREARARLIEARGLASLNGFERLLQDLHPRIAEILDDGTPHPPPLRPLRSTRTARPVGNRSRRRAADREGNRGPAAAGQRPVEQADRTLDGHQRRDREVAPEKPVRQAERRHPQARGGPRAPARSGQLASGHAYWSMPEITISTRRFYALPCAMSLDAIGRLSPKPSAASRFLEKPFSPEEAKPDLRANHEYLRVKYR